MEREIPSDKQVSQVMGRERLIKFIRFILTFLDCWEATYGKAPCRRSLIRTRRAIGITIGESYLVGIYWSFPSQAMLFGCAIGLIERKVYRFDR
jgi:hypothetical protein